MKRTLIAIAVLILGGVLVLAFRSRDSRDWAEIVLVSIETTQDGQITAHFTTRHSNGAGIESTHYVDGVAGGGGLVRGSGFPFTTSKGSETTMFHLNPERVPVSGSFTNSELFSRLRMRAGETRRFHAGETFSLYDFTAGGKRYSCVYRVIPHDEPYEPFVR